MMTAKVGDVSSQDMSNVEAETSMSYDTYEESVTIIKPKQKPGEISIRKNLNESVFFYPHLKTDEEGNLILSFTMNEALTNWKLLTFAHDKELRYGNDLTRSQDSKRCDDRA